MRLRFRTAHGGAALGLAALALVGCGGGGSGGPSSPALPGAAPGPGAGRSSRATHAHPARGGRHELAGLLRRELRLAGPHSGAYVYDVTTKQQVFTERSGVGRPPASVEKLFTSVALLSRLGPGARLRTTVAGRGTLGAGGVWHGNLYLRGGGDPTFASDAFRSVWQHGHGSAVSGLVAQIKAAGIRSVTGSLIGDVSYFDPLRGGPTTKYGPNLADLGGELSALTYNHGASGGTAKGAVSPGVYATEQLALALRAAGVQAVPAPITRRTPRHARLLATVSSPPVSELLRLMNVPSDDFYAEMLTKQLGARFVGAGSIPAGTSVITDTATDYRIHPTIADGSGLSRSDRSSPRQVVRLLEAMANDRGLGRVLSASLPVVGVNGTTRRIAKHTIAQGRCVGKTGTLDFVTNLAGYCNAAGHQQLAFAIFVEGPPNETGLAIIGRMVADMVRLDSARP